MGYPETVVNSEARSDDFSPEARRGVGWRSDGMSEPVMRSTSEKENLCLSAF
jgi:hypothetical protein